MGKKVKKYYSDNVCGESQWTEGGTPDRNLDDRETKLITKKNGRDGWLTARPSRKRYRQYMSGQVAGQGAWINVKGNT